MTHNWRRSNAVTACIALLAMAVIAGVTFVAGLTAPPAAAQQDLPDPAPPTTLTVERIYAGETSCDAPTGDPVPAAEAAQFLPITVCVYTTNVGSTVAAEIFVESDVLNGEGEWFYNVEVDAMVSIQRFVTSLDDYPAQSFTADMRDTFLEFGDFERELQALFDSGVITVSAFNNYFAATDLYALAGQGPDAVIEVDPELQRSKWDALGIGDYELVYEEICFCFWPANEAPPWKVRVIDGRVDEAVSISGGGAVSGITVEELFDEVADASQAQPARLSATFDLVYGYPTNWYVDRADGVPDDQTRQVVSEFVPLQDCGDGRFAPVGTCSAGPELEIERLVYAGNVDCSNDLAPLPDGLLTGNGRTTVCFLITNVGDALAEDISFSDQDYGLVDVQLGDLNPGESIGYRHFVDESSETFLADLRGVFLDSDDLEIELDELVDRDIVSAAAVDAYFEITDLYELAGQGPDGVIEVDPDLQRRKWQTLGIQDYEFDYRDNCFCFWPQDVEPPWRVQVLGGEVVSAVSISGGGAVAGTTLDAIVDRIERARSDEPLRIEADYDLLYGYPTRWFVDRDRQIADEEFGQSVLSFRPLRACDDQVLPVDETCVGIVSTVELYEGEVDCDAPDSPPLPDNIFLFSTLVTVCVTVTNFGDAPVTNVLVSVDDLPFPFEITIAEIAPGETVVEQSVIDRSIRSYELEPEQPDTPVEIDRLLTELVDSGTISATERAAWLAVSDRNGPVPGESVLETQINKWNALGLDDYEFTFRQFCFCPPEVNEPLRVRVVDGVVVSPVDDQFRRPLTVSEMFDRIDPDSSAFSITATFDRFFGVPTRWAIDSIELAVDDEVSVSISDFVPLVSCNGELVDLGTTCVVDGPDCSDWSRLSRQTANWWHSCWLEVLRIWLEQLDRDWAKAWGR